MGVVATLVIGIATACLWLWPVWRTESRASDRRASASQLACFDIPAGNASVRLRFIEHLLRRRPARVKAAILPSYVQRLVHACNRAADSVLAGEATLDERRMAIQYKLRCFALAHRFQVREVAAFEADFLEAVSEDSDPSIAALARRPLRALRQRQWPRLNPAAKRRFVQDIRALSRSAMMTHRDAELVAETADRLAIDGDRGTAIGLYEAVAAMFARRDAANTERLASHCARCIRRLTLIGREIDLQGVLFCGEELAWSSYRGHVVFVNFFAAWCDSSVTELAFLRHAYELYHTQGFDVVTIALDNESTMEQLINDGRIPWPVVFCDEAGRIGWNQAIVKRYGISRLPASLLIGRDGRVIALSPDLDQLDAELHWAFGKAA